jgi:PAS domain S-box-containing protein
MEEKLKTKKRSTRHSNIEERQAESLFAEFVNYCSDGIIIIQDGLIRFANNKMTELTGIQFQEAMGKPLSEFIAPEYKNIVLERYQRRMAGEAVPSQYEIEIMARNGSTIPIEINANTIELDGKITDFALIRDISGRKQAEKELTASEEKYRSLYENSNDAIMMGTLDGRILSANPAACRMFGRTEEEICSIGRDGISDISDPRLHKFLEERTRTGESKGELLFIRKDGTGLTGEISSHVFVDSEGQTRTSTIIRDVSGRRRADEILNAERENFRNSLETSPFGIQILTHKGDLVYSNHTVLDMWGCENIEQEKTIPLENKFTPESVTLIKQLNNQRQPGDIVRHYELTAIDKHGQHRTLQATSKEIIWNGDKAIQVVYQDITEQRQTEAILSAERENFRNSFETLPFGVQIVNLSNTLVYVNRTMLDMWGYETVEELRQIRLDKCFTPESVALIRNIQKHTKPGAIPPVHDLKMICKNGQLRDVRVYSKEMYWSGERCIQLLYEDITGRKRIEERITELNNTLLLIRNVNQLIVRVDSEIDLLSQGCDLIVEDRRYQLAWIGFIQEGSYDVVPLAMAGQATDYLDSIKVTWDNSLLGQGPTGIAIRTGTPCVITDTLNNPQFQPWKEEAAKKELRSVIALPLNVRGKVIGALTIYASTVDAFREKELDLLTELAADLSLGVEKIRQRVEQKKSEQALADESVRRRVLMEKSSDGIVILDQEGNVCEANNSFAEMIGYSPEETRHLNIFDWEFQFSPEQTRKILKTVDEKGERFETKYRRKDGSILDVDISINAAIFVDHKLIFYVCRDITPRKKMEETLEESLNYSFSLMENAPNQVIVFNPDTSIRYVNSTFINVNGWSANELVGIKAPYPWWTKEQKQGESFIDTFKSALSSGSGESEVIAQKKSGEQYWIHIKWAPIKKDGEISYIIVNSIDISERKKMEDQLRRSEEKFSKIWRSSPDPLMLISMADSCIVEVNESFLRMTGYTPDEVIGRTTLEMNLWCNTADHDSFFEQLRKYGRVPDTELDIRVKSGEVRNCVILGELLELPDGRHILGIIRDITEHKKMEDSLLVTDRLASIGELTSGIAHELNNPLTSVIGFSELLLEKQLPDDIREDVELMCKEARRTADVVKNMLTFARKHPSTREQLNVNSILNATLDMRAYEHKLSNIQVIKHLTEGLPEIQADHFQLQQVFLNIIINAEYFMIQEHGSGVLTVTTAPIGDMIRISITDDGPGISAENLNHMFDPFFTTKPVGKGTGLGLSICHGIIAEHGGRIYAESTPGKGATFIIELPFNA